MPMISVRYVDFNLPADSRHANPNTPVDEKTKKNKKKNKYSREARPTIDPRIPQNLVPLATTGCLRVLDPQYEQAAVPRVSEEQPRPLLRERGLRGRVRLLAVADGGFRDGRRRDGMRWEGGIACLVVGLT
jgi:hypothetical protein